MIIEYHRPQTVEETLALLARSQPVAVPLGGGTVLNQPSEKDFAVVDLQSLDLGTIAQDGREMTLGATVTLQNLLDSGEVSPALARAVRHEAAYNLRQMATVAGSLVAADGRSPFATVMLALDAHLSMARHESDAKKVPLGEFLPLQSEHVPESLITSVAIPSQTQLTYHYVARSPADLPIVCAAVAQWPSGRTRVALGGHGEIPLLVLDGRSPDGAEKAARSAYSQAGDQWASAEYRSDVADTLVRRCVEELGE